MHILLITRCTKHVQKLNILLTKITATQNEVELSYHTVCGLYFLAVVFAVTILFMQIFLIVQGREKNSIMIIKIYIAHATLEW